MLKNAGRRKLSRWHPLTGQRRKNAGSTRRYYEWLSRADTAHNDDRTYSKKRSLADSHRAERGLIKTLYNRAHVRVEITGKCHGACSSLAELAPDGNLGATPVARGFADCLQTIFWVTVESGQAKNTGVVQNGYGIRRFRSKFFRSVSKTV